MSYVDLNPIRAGIAQTPEDSEYTSIQQRIDEWRQRQEKRDAKAKQNADARCDRKRKTPSVANVKLMPLVRAVSDRHPNAIGYTFKDYLELIDWAGRAIRDEKRGSICESAPPILSRLGLDTDAFVEHVKGGSHRRVEPRAFGALDKLKKFAQSCEQKFIRGQGYAQRLHTPT